MTTRDLSHPGGDWTHGRVEINGVDMHYVREGSGLPVLLLHGWPEFWWGWHRNIPVLSKHFDIVAPDFRGFGDTVETRAEPAGPDTHAADILALADALGFERFGLVSHDVGAYVAQTIARKAPDRVAGLFFFNGPHPGIGRRWVEATQIREIWYQSFNQMPWAAQLVGHNRETCRIFFENMLRHWGHVQEAFDGQIDFFVDNFMKPGNIEGGFAWYKASHEARMALIRDGAPDLAPIETPARFFWGRHDPILRSDWTDNLGDYFANAEIEIADSAGHFVHFEAPDRANPRVIDFFNRLDISAPPC
ncbi:alpha/beta fold hydrolase [Hwanghaeella sp.]|uniref:alpha/beta fold hydrolase n=1 Tax=Hwanghaeella sp. TaxID=2605943 RepID=UPI003CCB76FD